MSNSVIANQSLVDSEFRDQVASPVRGDGDDCEPRYVLKTDHFDESASSSSSSDEMHSSSSDEGSEELIGSQAEQIGNQSQATMIGALKGPIRIDPLTIHGPSRSAEEV